MSAFCANRTAGVDVNRSFLLAYAGFVAAEKQPFP
jgi:hypothetical protein